MTPEARKLLSSTVRALRARLLADLRAAMQTTYRLDAPHDRLDAATADKRARLEAWLDQPSRPHGSPGARTREAQLRELEQQAAYRLLQRLVVTRLMAASGAETSRLAADLPGLFGAQDPASLVPVPEATLRHASAALDMPALAPCWTDDMTPGWVHQYWNDPEREALDARLSARGKLEPHEVASKTQLFTERYMVEWLLHNTLGPMWLAICRRHGWIAEAEASGTLLALEARRGEWRDRRARGEVSPVAAMPIDGRERHWAYYLPQPRPADAPLHAPASIRDLRLLDPAVGSGHFLVLAFDLLFALHEEEARHRGETGDPRWSPRAITESILEHNLHGLDIDPRAVQIAAAALYIKARRTCPKAQPRRLNLVASDLRLASREPALVALRRALERDIGIPAPAIDTLVDTLRNADHLGSLLRVEALIDAALDARGPLDREPARALLREHIEQCLSSAAPHDDLGLQLGEALAPGVRFLRLLREDHYDLVVGNPPYQGTARLADSTYVQTTYARGKADLYAAFLERGLQLVRPGGMSALLTMRNWMFIQQYTELRQWLLEHYDLRALGDFDRGAFEDVPDERVSVVASVFRRAPPGPEPAVALQPTPPDDTSRDSERTRRKHAAVLAQIGRHEFHPASLKVVPEWPVVHWWDDALLSLFNDLPKLGELAPTRKGLCTGDDLRACRFPWELDYSPPAATESPRAVLLAGWVPTIMGGKGRAWIEPLSLLLKWHDLGLENKVMHEARWGSHTKRVQSESFYARRGVAFSMIGAGFRARVHRFPSIFGNMGSSVFSNDLPGTVASMNAALSRSVLTSLNPGMHVEVGDVDRLPLFPIADAGQIFATLERAFAEHESHRETSVEFRRPGPSPWRHAQAWAQAAVDRPAGAPLPAYTPHHDPEPAAAHCSYALGVALGRFDPAGEGILAPASDRSHALPAGILFLDNTLAPHDLRDSLGHAAAGPLRTITNDPRAYFSRHFFAVHRKMYENRPIHWPLSSSDRTFVAWITIHRWTADTLQRLLTDHLRPALARIDGSSTRASVQRARDELVRFIAAVQQIAEHGPPADHPRYAREVDAPYVPAQGDGVRVNAAALWPLLAPQWKDPRNWWQQWLAAASKPDGDWSKLAMRYWPTRVDAKCQRDPSLAVAHGCFFKYHPARAWAWELRLQDEIDPTFRIAEPPYRDDGGHTAHRRSFLAEQPAEALAIVEKEALRRLRRHGRLAELVLLEPGLWRARPDLCWALELRVLARQGQDFRLRAPDEPAAREAFMRANPALVQQRHARLQAMTSST
jgi:hypothetical protein